jgi:hypothetical protein
MVQAWYQGGISMFDFTDSARPVEIAFFDRGPLDAKTLFLGGLLVVLLVQRPDLRERDRPWPRRLQVKPSEFLSQNEITAATLAHTDTFNAQEQMRVTWPATAVVGRAYLDQLARTHALQGARADAVRTALDRADSLAPRSAKSAEAAQQLDAQAAQLEASLPADAVDRARATSLVSLLRTRAAALR